MKYFYRLFGLICSGVEQFFIPVSIALRTCLNPPVQYLDAAFQRCGPDNAIYITQPYEYPQPAGTVFIKTYEYEPIDIMVYNSLPSPNNETVDNDDRVTISLKKFYDFDEDTLFRGQDYYVDSPGAVPINVADSITRESLSYPTASTISAQKPEMEVASMMPEKIVVNTTNIAKPVAQEKKDIPADVIPEARSNPPMQVSVELNEDDVEDSDPYIIVPWKDGYYVTNKDNAQSVRATNFVIKPKAMKHILDGDGSERKSFVFLLVRPPHANQTMEIPTSDLKNILTIITKECAEAIVFRNKIRNAFDVVFQVKLREKLDFCPHTYEIRYSGWFMAPSGQYCFCDDGSKPPNDHIIFQSGFSFQRGTFKRGEQETAKAGWGILRLANMDTIGILFLFAHLGLLYHLFEEAGYPPRVLLFIEGPTGSLKTAVASLLFNFSGLPEQKIPATFRDTSASMEIKFAKYRDRVLLVDDFCPAADASSRRVMEASLEQLVRFFGDGIAKGRATPSMDHVKELKPCGLVAMTGEDSAGSQSSLLRCLFLQIAKDSFDKAILQQYQEDPTLWTEYLAQFVAQLAPEAPKAIKFIKKQFPIYRTEAEKYMSEKRLIDTYAYLSITADLAVAMAQKNLPIDDTARARFHAAVLTVCQNSELKAKTASPVRIFCRKLLELLQQNKVHLTVISNFKVNPDEYLGFEKDGFWFLWPDDTYSVICRSYQTTGKVFPKSQTALWGDLVSSGVLIPTRTKCKNGTERLEYGTKMGFGDRPRMLKIDPDRLRAIAEDKDG